MVEVHTMQIKPLAPLQRGNSCRFSPRHFCTVLPHPVLMNHLHVLRKHFLDEFKTQQLVIFTTYFWKCCVLRNCILNSTVQIYSCICRSRHCSI